MRATWMGLALGVFVVLFFTAQHGSSSATSNPGPDGQTGPGQPFSPNASSTRETIAFQFSNETGGHFITVIHQPTNTLAVYGLDSKTGRIALKSVRNYAWDLRMEEFNSDPPAPHEIRALQQPARRIAPDGAGGRPPYR